MRFFVGGFPRSRGDSVAFKGRSWYQSMLNPGSSQPLLEDGEFILGDAGFALAPFLITPFRGADMHGPNVASMRWFNHLHAKMRVVVESAFGRLKGRWHVLRITNAHPTLAASVQELCVLLHNFLEERNGAYDEEAWADSEEEEPAYAEPDCGDAVSSAGTQRRTELFKALRLPWVANAE